jgi:superfamily II DNA or RNA helicase
MNNPAYIELKNQYNDLLEENRQLKQKIKALEAGSKERVASNDGVTDDAFPYSQPDAVGSEAEIESNVTEYSSISKEIINKHSAASKKIQLFMSLFRGRSDVYAKRWENKKGGSGYSPVCSNEWKPGICFKPKVKCFKCSRKAYSQLNEAVIEAHLLGKSVVGIYPMNPDETCFFLAMDFDKEGWHKDVSAVRDICNTYQIPVAVERSRSGNGGHVWFFFEDRFSASAARKFGMSLLTKAMEKRHELPFSSYDRLFPNQDTMPEGGLGNLIALPLQKSARNIGNAVFIDDRFEPHEDQWAFLSGVQKLSEQQLQSLTEKLGRGNELGLLKTEIPDDDKPWIKKQILLDKADFPETVEMIKAEMLYIKKTGISQKALNRLKRLAAFKNPEFFKRQAMRMPTFGVYPVICCSDDFKEYLALPRGCEEDVIALLNELHIRPAMIEKHHCGKTIDVEFNGELWPEQQDAANQLMRYDRGVLCATTAFGKTVVGANLIARRKTNTLILVHRQQLMLQWKERLSQFLVIHEKLLEPPKQRGRKKKISLIGQLGGGKNQLSSIVDIAIMQSLNNAGEVKDCIQNYGMVLVDECHHVSAVSFEQILKKTPAKYVYGLTATPYRRDGQHPIIFFHCGPIRYQVDAKKQAEERPFDHYLIPRFTNFRASLNEEGDPLTIQEIYSRIMEDDIRNQAIITDVVECHKKGRNSLVITGRIAHVASLGEELARHISDVILLTGGMGSKKTTAALETIEKLPNNRPFVLVATGSFIGEGFDESRLDTLFLAMPVSWKGTLQQYAGRLHRLHDGKKDVQIYDYVDIHVKMLETMYGKRLKGYASIGYMAKADNIADSPTEIIFNKQNFFPVYLNDIDTANEHILIVSPFMTQKRILQVMDHFREKIDNHVKVSILTRPAEEFQEEKRGLLNDMVILLQHAGINVLLKPGIHQKFAIIDHKIVWFGSINLLSFGHSEESIMRLVSNSIAYELSNTINTLAKNKMMKPLDQKDDTV